MKFTQSWLNEHLSFTVDKKIIEKELTNLGLEVESIKSTTSNLESMYVCEIINVKKHPNADKLQICQLTTGKNNYSVVCGAYNAVKGLRSVFAPNGSYIPGKRFKLEKKKIRGIDGDGMLCSEEELGISSESAGIIELDKNYKVGKCFKEYVQEDFVYEIALTPNRGDCASVRGIARDLAAKFFKKIKKKEPIMIKKGFKPNITFSFDELENKSFCPLILGREFNIQGNPESPQWLKEKLKSIGLKPISGLVDITNYILFDIGRPLHVFDKKKIAGNVNVRLANKEEVFIGLDNKNYYLTEKDLVIADEEKVLSLAGVMGGLHSSVTKNTKEVLLEVAYFDPNIIARTGRRHNIITDSRYRFERGIDKNGLYEGLEIATQLINKMCGGFYSDVIKCGKQVKENDYITLKFSAYHKIIGHHVNKVSQIKILKSLGCKLENVADNECMVIPPSWRHDLKTASDLIEEICRVEGYNKIAYGRLRNSNSIPKPIFSNLNNLKINIREALAYKGLNEIISFTFVSPKKVIPENDLISDLTINNPISIDMSVMRNSLFPNLLDAVSKNYSKGIDNTKIFEIGYIFNGTSYENQKLNLGIVLSGFVSKRTWHQKRRCYDFFDIKQIFMENINFLSDYRVDIIRSSQPWYHPGKSADIFHNKKVIGGFGEIHPEIAKKFNIKSATVLGSIDLHEIEKYSKSSKNIEANWSALHTLKKDFSFLLPTEKTTKDLIQVIKASDNLIGDIKIFDVYNEEKSDKAFISIGLEIEIKQTFKVLNSSEIGQIMNKVIEDVKEKLGVVLRT